jgi:hypothetical protein
LLEPLDQLAPLSLGGDFRKRRLAGKLIGISY